MARNRLWTFICGPRGLGAGGLPRRIRRPHGDYSGRAMLRWWQRIHLTRVWVLR